MRKLVLCFIAFAVTCSAGVGHGKTLDEYVQEAEAHEKSGQLERAIEVLEEAVKAYPEDPNAYAHWGLSLGMLAGKTDDFMEAGRLIARAFSVLDSAVSLDSQNALARFNRGLLGVEVPDFLGKLGGGIEDLEFFIELYEQNPEKVSAERLPLAYDFLGRGYAKREETDKARLAWEKVAELAPGTPMAENARESVKRLTEVKRRKTAEERVPMTPAMAALKENVEKEPDNPFHLVELGKASFDAGYYENAKEALKKAVNLDPSNREAVRWLVLTLERLAAHGYDERIYKNTDYRTNLAFELMEILDKAVALDPDDSEFRLTRGITGVQMPFFVRKLDQGIDDLQWIIQSDVPDSTKATALYWLGVAHQKKGMSYWIEVVSKHSASQEYQMVFDGMRPPVQHFDLSEHRTPLVAIDFTLGFRDELPPQSAVWIEDEKGRFVKTIYVSGFSGNVKERQIVLPQWANSSQFSDVDAITGASIDVGHYVYTWDLTDSSGKRAKKGNYVVNVEVHYWPSMEYQIVSAPITVKKKDKGVVVEEGNLIPRLEVTYFHKGGK